MRIAVRVKPGMHRDRLWRGSDGLYAHIRAAPKDGEANDYLIKYLSGSLRVARSLITIVHGHTSSHKLINIAASETDLGPMLAALPPTPQASLFDE